MKEIKNNAIQNLFKEMNKDCPDKFNLNTKEGREFVNKYHALGLEIDEKIQTAKTTLSFLLEQDIIGTVKLNEFVIDLIGKQIEKLEA